MSRMLIPTVKEIGQGVWKEGLEINWSCLQQYDFYCVDCHETHNSLIPVDICVTGFCPNRMENVENTGKFFLRPLFTYGCHFTDCPSSNAISTAPNFTKLGSAYGKNISRRWFSRKSLLLHNLTYFYAEVYENLTKDLVPDFVLRTDGLSTAGRTGSRDRAFFVCLLKAVYFYFHKKIFNFTLAVYSRSSKMRLSNYLPAHK